MNSETNDIESNQGTETEEEVTNVVDRSYRCCLIYVILMVCFIIATVIYGIVDGDKYSPKQINSFYIAFIGLTILPILTYLLYLTCKWDQLYCVM